MTKIREDLGKSHDAILERLKELEEAYRDCLCGLPHCQKCRDRVEYTVLLNRKAKALLDVAEAVGDFVNSGEDCGVMYDRLVAALARLEGE